MQNFRPETDSPAFAGGIAPGSDDPLAVEMNDRLLSALCEFVGAADGLRGAQHVEGIVQAKVVQVYGPRPRAVVH